jgi:Ca2+-binding RTX toxin-like protein
MVVKAVGSPLSGWLRGATRARALLGSLGCSAVLVTASLSTTDADVQPVNGDSAYSLGFFIEWAWDIAVGPDGSAYMTGYVFGDFQTTPGAADESYNGSGDAFVARIDPTGRLLYATVLGGQYSDSATEIAVDSSGAAYVAGHTDSAWGDSKFPTTAGAISDDYSHPTDTSTGFLAKISPDGSTVEYSTVLPGVRYVNDLVVTPDDQAHLAGEAYPDFQPTAAAFDQTAEGDAEGYIATVNPDGTEWTQRSFIGGSKLEFLYDLEVDRHGATYLTGLTRSPDFPTTGGAFDTSLGGYEDAFAMKLSDAGTVEWSTFIGGRADDAAFHLGVGNAGDVYLTGRSDAIGFPTTPGSPPGTPDDNVPDSWIGLLNPSGSTLTYAGFVPASVGGMQVDRHGDFVVTATRPRDDSFGPAVGTGPFAAVYDTSGTRHSVMPLNQEPFAFDLDPAGTLYVLGEPITARAAARSIDGTSGRARSYVSREARCTIRGTTGADVIQGTRGPDVICAGPGNDVVDGGGGYDIVRLGAGRDRVDAGPGIDIVLGGDGADMIAGGARRDLVRAGAGADVVRGDGGMDELRGERGVDRLLGGAGRDLLVGGDGWDACFGGDGRNRLAGCETR